ncbi:murein biosynthesis integral membrane protein MurJ [Desulfurivibrio alkaliphilus]|uniref:Probable lipid II flippase MurJ n=1 Tax=Desulfurivibrio alkaliphilus (strain DSM 19089 / UNIQEM U267 / AHT2) TaxID=589865 RepID=D6Z2K2_DESAT|nr:murein biosynthesis integral membrane protein MurJ [Desulfurivibrio alkaliphilus]ADH85777.1 integral membrane protein MviN [Desulfurivibrio alkaliphilus AHT 2]
MAKKSDQTGTIARSAAVVSFAVLCSRILGLVREQAFAILFGAGYAFDAFVVAFRIPNMLRDLFGEGALSAAFVAVFAAYNEKGEKETWRLASNVLVFFGLFLSVLTLVGIFASEHIVRLLVQDEYIQVPGKVELTARLTAIMFPFLTLVSLAAVVMGVLNTKGRFFVPAMAGSFFNLGALIGGVSLSLLMPRFDQPAIVGMAIGVLIGGVLQLGCQLPTLRRTGFRFVPHLDLRDPGLRRILVLMMPAVIGLAPLQFNIVINTYFASSLAEGTLSWLNYAFRLFWLPVGLFGVALSVATMPVVSRFAAQKDMPNLKNTYVSSLTMAFCLSVPASVGLIILAQPIVRVIFQHGRFDVAATVGTAEVLACYAVGLFAYAAVKIMVPIFYALDRPRYPVIGSFLTMLVNLLIILAVLEHLEHRALALSISGAMTVNFIFLSVMLYRLMGGYPLAGLARGLGKIVLASLLMAGWLYGLQRLFFPGGISEERLLLDIAAVAVCIGSSALLYGLALQLLKLEEMNLLVRRLLRRG